MVWSAVHKTTRKEYAIKVMKATASATPKDGEVSVDEIRNEIEVMEKLQHANVVYIKEYFVQNGKFYIVMSHLRGGELLDALLDLGNYTVSQPRSSFHPHTNPSIPHTHPTGRQIQNQIQKLTRDAPTRIYFVAANRRRTPR